MSYSIKSNNGYAKWQVTLIAIVVVLLLIGTASFLAHRYYQQQLDPVSANQSTELFEIATGDGAQAIAERLEADGLIRASWAFSWYMRTQGLRGDIQAGTYAISPNLSIPQIAATITGQTRAEAQSVTILPERRLDQIRADLINAGFIPEEVDEALDAQQYSDHPALADKPADASLEGYLYPETFSITEMTTAQEVIEQSLDEMASRLSPSVRDQIRSNGLTVHEGIILASVVEREVSQEDPEDRAKVAQVFYSRLTEDIRLESNATARYGAVLAGLDPDEHPSYNSPYNTYRYDGLPPSPISNVSESSILAVAQPADTEYLYFVSADDCLDPETPCTNYFSTTLAEHEAKVQQYCPVRCSRPH